MIPKLDLSTADDDFKEEICKSLIQFVQTVSSILDEVDDEVEKLRNQGFEDSLLEKMDRDIKAQIYDRIDAALSNM